MGICELHCPCGSAHISLHFSREHNSGTVTCNSKRLWWRRRRRRRRRQGHYANLWGLPVGPSHANILPCVTTATRAQRPPPPRNITHAMAARTGREEGGALFAGCISDRSYCAYAGERERESNDVGRHARKDFRQFVVHKSVTIAKACSFLFMQVCKNMPASMGKTMTTS